MNCPNCGHYYDSSVTVCPKCKAPLSNAEYAPVSQSNKMSKKPSKGLLIFMIILILACGISAGAYCYLYIIKKNCTQATETIFSYAQKMDFSEVDSRYLPDLLKENPNIRVYMQEQFNQTLQESNMMTVLNLSGIHFDTDQLCDDIISDARFEIIDAKPSYNSCTVTVKTSNLDYCSLPSAISKEIIQNFSIDGETLWQSIKNTIVGLFSGDDGDEDEEHESLSERINSDIKKYYDEAREGCKRIYTTSDIVFEKKDGEWTITSFDEKLFYTYYGITKN